MKGLSIKQRVTLFYAAILISMTALVCAFLLFTADFQSQSMTNTALEKAVKDATEGISYFDDRIEIDPDFDFYINGVAILLYGPKGTPLAGTAPTGFPAATPLLSDELQTAEGAAETFRVYDLYLRHPDATGLWIRGVYALGTGRSLVSAVTRTALIALPALIALAILGGYMITKRAFAPIARIRAAAEDISSGGDLARRIELHDSKDELFDLACTLNHMIERLERTFENERQFTSDVSHELRTPISVILSQCEYALESGKTPEDERRALESVALQARRMSALVSQLLELSRSTASPSPLALEPVSLSALCEGVAEEMQPRAGARRIRVIQKLAPDVTIQADETQVLRLLINLMTNAIRYGREGGFVMLSLTCEGAYARISVSDDGVGIAEENLTRIFNRFFREDAARSKAQGDSFGLGLSYVKWIAEAHGGSVEVKSTKGVGSEFSVLLPLTQPAAEAARKEERR